MPGYMIEVYFDPLGICGGQHGCFRARVQGHPEIHDAGQTAKQAYDACVITAASLGLPSGDHNYHMDLSRLEP